MANTVDKVLKIAEAEVGYLEKKNNSNLDDKTANAGNANYTKYGRDMHEIYPSIMDFPAAWCDAFVDWCFYKAYGVCNAKGLLGGNFNDYTPSSAQLYKNKNAWHKTPKVGDQIFFTNGVRINHTGLVYKVDANYVYTIEGNTSGANGVIVNGGGVCKKSYSINNSRIAGYGRPKYDVEKVVYKMQTLKKGSTGNHVTIFETLMKEMSLYNGKIDTNFGNGCVAACNEFQKKYPECGTNGKPDGSFGPKCWRKVFSLFGA